MGIPKEYEDGCKIPKEGCIMDWLIRAKKGGKCPDCGGSGYVPLEDETQSADSEYTIEIECRACKGKGKKFKWVNISLESLKDLLK